MTICGGEIIDYILIKLISIDLRKNTNYHLEEYQSVRLTNPKTYVSIE